MKRVDVASTLIFDAARERVIMVKNKSGDDVYWSLPGGAVEAGETLEQAAKRETKEEAGLDVEIIGLHSVREAIFGGIDHAVVFTFEATIAGGDMTAADPDKEIMEVAWVDIQTANERLAGLLVQLNINSDDKCVPYRFHGIV